MTVYPLKHLAFLLKDRFFNILFQLILRQNGQKYDNLVEFVDESRQKSSFDSIFFTRVTQEERYIPKNIRIFTGKADF